MQLSIGDASPSQVYSPRKQSNKNGQSAAALDIHASILFQSAYWESELGPWRIPPDLKGYSYHRRTPCLLPLWAGFGLILHQNAERAEINTQFTVNASLDERSRLFLLLQNNVALMPWMWFHKQKKKTFMNFRGVVEPVTVRLVL